MRAQLDAAPVSGEVRDQVKAGLVRTELHSAVPEHTQALIRDSLASRLDEEASAAAQERELYAAEALKRQVPQLLSLLTY